MSVSGPSPLGTLMVQRVEAALGVTLSQQANLATGARPDAVTQPGQSDKIDPIKNPPPKEHEGARQVREQSGRQAGLAALTRNDPEIAKLLAARNAPMAGYTASAPTSLGLAAKAILALLQQFPDGAAARGRAPLLAQGTPAGAAGAAGGTPGSTAGASNTAANTASTAAGAAASSTAAAGGAGAAPAGIAGQLTAALSQALQSSGVFYEAHLREFAFGQRTLEQMRAEPQAQAGQHAARGGTTAESGASRGGEPAAGQPPTATPQAGQPGQAAQSAQAANAAHTAQASLASQSAQAAQAAAPQTHNPQLAGALLGLDPSTHALVRQQLETLANQAFAWQGEAWPGAGMEWEVQRRESQGGEEYADSWSTRLKLNLPRLGEVQARLSLSGSQLVMHLVSPDGADLMAEHTETLRQGLNRQGLQLSQLTLSREPGEAEVHAGTMAQAMAETKTGMPSDTQAGSQSVSQAPSQNEGSAGPDTGASA